jgi:hypothetical protein
MEMVECAHVAKQCGYKVEIYAWNKSDLLGKSHTGGARQATSSEYIVVVYKHEDAASVTLNKHFALLKQKTDLEAELRQIGPVGLLFFKILNFVFLNHVKTKYSSHLKICLLFVARFDFPE